MIGRFRTWVAFAASALLVTAWSAAGAGPAAAAPSAGWQHAALIYHAASRTQQQWEQHLMAVNASGQFTGKWLFDAVILTTQTIDGQNIMYASLTGPT
ncbi:MAG: hypothetical protein JO016_04590 [Actinobacteria bacterium]|nr:hypothetical protein [Actinomycetota bacterium]